MNKPEQDTKIAQLGAIAVEEAAKLAHRHGCSEPRRVFIVIAFEQVEPDMWAHGTGIGHPSDVVPDARVLLERALASLTVLH